MVSRSERVVREHINSCIDITVRHVHCFLCIQISFCGHRYDMCAVGDVGEICNAISNVLGVPIHVHRENWYRDALL